MAKNFKLPLAPDNDGKAISTHMSINPYLLTIYTADNPSGAQYDGSQAITIDTTVALQLGTATVGSASQPIYLDNGVPTACSLSSFSDWVLKAGDEMEGYLKLYGHGGTEDLDYGETLPLDPVEGQIFFQYGDSAYELPLGGTAGQSLVKKTATDRDVEWATVGGLKSPSQAKYYVAGSSVISENTNAALFNTSIYVENSVLFGAAWNDYAEYRETKQNIAPGHCVIEVGDGTLVLSTSRMQPGAEIVSDTFGFAIGQTEKCGLPIAVSGRVLAYPYEPISEFKIGQPVCSGPNGTVSQMTDQEARDYPWLVIGTVSSIPQEKEWGQNKIKVNGRIWIRVR